MKKILTITLALMVAITFSFAMPQTASAASKPGKIKKITGYNYIENKVKTPNAYSSAVCSKSKNAKKYEFYRATSKVGKYKKVATKKYGVFSQKMYGLSYIKARGVNGSKKGTFSPVAALYLYQSDVESVTSDLSKNTTTFKIFVDNSKSSIPMYICTAEDGNKITCTEEIYDIDNDKTVSKKKFPFTYKFADENRNPITDESITVPAKASTYLYMVADSADVKTYWDASIVYAEEDDEDEDEYWEDEDEELYETYYRFNLDMNFYALSGETKETFKSTLYGWGQDYNYDRKMIPYNFQIVHVK